MIDKTKHALERPSATTLEKGSTRVILAVATICLLISKLLYDYPPLPDIIIVSAIALYFVCTTVWLHFTKTRNIARSFYQEITIADALFVAAASTYFFFSATISSLLFLFISFNALVTVHFRSSLSSMGAFLIGIAVISAVFPTAWQIGADTLPIFILIVGLLLYLMLFAYSLQSSMRVLETTNKKLYSDLVLHKVRSYKLSRYVTPTVWRALNKGQDASLKADRKRITIFFSDIAGFSALSEELEAEVLTEILNSYLTEMVKIASKHNATIDKFMGDGVMILFGDTNSSGIKADCIRCVSMALDMRKKMKELETRWYNQGIKKPLKIRMGINSGYCTVGTFGTSEYMDYTALGTHVNLASRLESAAEPGEILVSHETWSLIKDLIMCRDRGEILAKGFSHPIKVYQIVDFRKEMGGNQSYFEEHIQGFSMHLDLQKVKNYDRERIIDQLQAIMKHLKDKH